MSGAVCDPDVFLLLVCYLSYAWRAARFLQNHLGARTSRGRVFFVSLFVGRVVMALFLENRGVPYILYALCGHGLLMGLTLAVFGAGRGKEVLAAVIWETMTGLIWGFGQSFLTCAGLIAVHTMSGSGQMTFLGIWAERIILFMTYVIGIIAVSLLSGPLGPVFSDKREGWYSSLAVPLGCMVLVTDIVNWAASNGILVQDRGRFGLYENQLFSHGAMCIFTALAMAAAGFFVFGMERIYREEETRQQYQSQVMYYRMMEEQYRLMERLRHDMKNHIIALDSLVENRQWEKACCYLNDMAGFGGVETGDEVTGSLVMDALFYHKRRQAAEWGIEWQCDAKLPKDMPIKEMDLCIIAGNMLDNAIEACRRLRGQDPFIRVYMGTIKQCLLLEVRNSTDLTDTGEICKSRKENPGEHGFGFANIKAAAAGYNGAVHVETEKGIFVTSVLLPLYRERSV